MDYTFDIKCSNYSKSYKYHTKANGFKTIHPGSTSVIVLIDSRPMAICPYCDEVKNFKYYNSMSMASEAVYVEIPKALKENDYAYRT